VDGVAAPFARDREDPVLVEVALRCRRGTDRHGGVVHYGERECSVQRRHQKVVEESPSPVLDDEQRERMGEAACQLAAAVDYEGAGTVEFLVSQGQFYFLEMNTRLQVEHPITEERYGVDLVREQLRVAAGERLAPVGEPRGHAIEVRINAEDPDTFLPSLGRVDRVNLPGGPGVRIDSCLYSGLDVSPYYDSMLGKLIVHAADRPTAIERMRRALREFRVVGVSTTVPVALAVLDSAAFQTGDYDTATLESLQRGVSESFVDVASLAAAVAKFIGAERAATPASAGEPAVSPWQMIDRLQRLGGRPR